MNFKTAATVFVAGFLTVGAAYAEDALVRIATDGAYPPWASQNSKGELEGFEIDLANFICKNQQIKCEISAQSWDGIIPALQANKFDVIMGGMSVTAEREKVMAFSRPYALGGNTFLVRKDGDVFGSMEASSGKFVDPSSEEGKQEIAKIDKLLAGKAVGVQGTTTAADFMAKNLPAVTDVREYKSTEEHNLDLISGRLDAVLANYTVQASALERPELHEETALVGPVFSSGFIAAGLRKEDTKLKQILDEGISAAIADGTLKKLSEKWFKVDVSPRD